VPQVCEPLTAFCQENTAKVCNSKGSGLDNSVDCGEQVCVDGECKEKICTPDSSYCDGDLVMQCNGYGTEVSVASTCAANQYCDQGDFSATCEMQVCSPAQMLCQDNSVMQCNDIGSGMNKLKECDAVEELCKGGKCLILVDGRWILNGNGTVTDFDTSLVWDQNGLALAYMLYAPAAEYCEVLDKGGITEWRLPQIEELRTLVVGCPSVMPGGECQALNTCAFCEPNTPDPCSTGCDGCLEEGGPGEDGTYLNPGVWQSTTADKVWSSTKCNFGQEAWVLFTKSGWIADQWAKSDMKTAGIWCVSGP